MTPGILEHVGMCEIRTSASPDVAFVVPGLGSCIALVIYQPNRQIAGLAHILLPESAAATATEAPGKFADTAVPRLVEDLIARGAERTALVAKMAGGAQMFKSGAGLSIGERNVQAVTQVLAAHGIPVVAADVGGVKGRTIRFEVASERYWVRGRGGEEVVLE